MTKQWEQFREIIIAEYRDNKKPLHEVRRLMGERYGFRASIRAYRSRFDKWGIQKYSRRRRGGSMGEDAEADDARYLTPHQNPELDDPRYQGSSPAMTPGDLFHPDTSTTTQSNECGGPFIKSEPTAPYRQYNVMHIHSSADTSAHLSPMPYNTYPHHQALSYPTDQMSPYQQSSGNVLMPAQPSPNHQNFEHTLSHISYGYSYNRYRR